MTWGCRESEDTRDYNADGGLARGSRRFHVWSTDETFDEPLRIIDKFGRTGDDPQGTQTLPNYGDYFNLSGDLVAITPRIRLIDSQAWLWEVEWAYLESVFGVGTPNDVGYVSVSISSRGGFKDAWRANPAYPPLVNGIGGVLAGNVVEVGGMVVDLAGAPMSVPSDTSDIAVSVTIDTLPQLAFLDAQKGKRNSLPILQAAAGRLLFTGYTMADVSPNRWRFTYNFASDADYHLLQYPARDSLGAVILSNVGVSYPGTGTTIYNFASSVLWRQPFPNTVNFYTLNQFFNGRI